MTTLDASPGVRPDSPGDEADEVRAMSDLLASPPRFVLASAVCNDLGRQRSIIAELSQSHAGLVTVDVRTSDVDPFTSANLAAPSDPTAVFVTGLASWLGDPDVRRQRSTAMNASRERWVERFGCPVVLWMNETTARWLALHAPDLWRYRSHRFEFVGTPPSTDPPMFEPVTPTDGGWGGLSAEARRRRMDELTARLDANRAADDDAVGRLLAKWLHELASHHEFFGELVAAADALGQEHHIGQRLADESVISSAVGGIGRIQAMLGNLDVGEAMLRQALDTDRRLRRSQAAAAAVANLGNIARARGDIAAADVLFREAATEADRAGDLPGRASALNNLAASAMIRGDAAAAEPLIEQALDLYRRAARLDGESTALSNLGVIAFRRGDLDAAQRLHEAGLALDRTTGRLDGEVRHLTALGFINESRGDIGAARSLWTQALDRVAPYGVPAWSEHFRELIERLSPFNNGVKPRQTALSTR